MLNLDNITLISINSTTPNASIKALEISRENINFKKTILLSDKSINHEFIETINIPNIQNIQQYNFFCVKHLYKYIDTEYCLIIQPDGFVINPSKWDDDFLSYDYIGAPWNIFHSANGLHRCGFNISDFKKIPLIVGNGGFSLRSKKILTEVSKFDYNNLEIPEDNVFSILHRKELKDKNIKYPPVNLALKFSIEHFPEIDGFKFDIKNHFGFHGKLNHFQEILNKIK